jgi:hypothetical protein
MEPKWMRVKFRGIVAANLESACVLLEQAGISIAKDEGQKAGFEVGQRRGSANRTTVLEATVLLDNHLKQVWKGNRMVNERRLVCEESQGVEEEEEQTERNAKLSPTNPMLQTCSRSGYRFGTLLAWTRSTSTKSYCSR